MKRPNGYWNFNTILEAAKTCTSITEFYKKYPGAKDKIYDLGISNEIFKLSNLEYKIAPKGTWQNIEIIKKEALKYKHRADFENYASGAYDAALRYNWIDIVCKHMIPKNNLRQRALYAFEYSDKSVYIGLTWNYNQRYSNHLKNPELNKKRSKYKETFIKFNIFYPYNIASIEEGKLIEQYRKNGWSIINKAKPGGLGGSRVFWTFDRCLNEAKKYKRKMDFRITCPSAYVIMCRNNWKDDIYKKVFDI